MSLSYTDVYKKEEINYSYKKLNNLKDGLNEQRNNLQTILNTIKSVDEKLCTSLVGKTKTALEEKTKEIEDEFNKKIEDLTDIIDNLDIANDGILKIHWSGEGRDAFKTKINEWADSLKDVKTEMKTAKNAVTRLDEDTYRLISLAESIIIAGR